MENNPSNETVPTPTDPLALDNSTLAVTPIYPAVEAVPPVEIAPVNGVWVSKEEYERLRAAAPIGSGAEPSFPDTTEKDPDYKNFWTYAGGIIALIIFAGLTFNLGGWFNTPIIIGIIIFTILAVKSLVKPKVEYITSANSAPRRKSAFGVIGIVLALVILVPLAPIIFFFFIILALSASGQSVGS